MRIAIYARVSTAAQAEEGYSLAAQVEDCTKYAKANLQPTLIKEYVDDGYSGAFLERPALEQLRQDLALNIYDAVVCYDADRLARGLTTQLVITDEIEKHCKLYFCNMEYQRTPEGQLFYQIKGAFSGYEREKIKQRSMRGKLAKLKQGKALQNYRIYGYDYINDSYVINEDEAPIVKRIFEMYNSGSGGVITISKVLTEEGIPSPRGFAWGRSTVNRILKRQAYAGVHIANRFSYTKVSAHKVACSERPQQEWIAIDMPAIISEEDFAQAQERLRNGKKFRRKEDADCLVQGIAVCGVCGQPMHINASKPIRYLRCNSNGYYSSVKPCGARTIRIDVLDKVFWSLIKKVCSNKKTLAKYLASANKDKSPDISKLQKEKQSIVKEKATLIEWWHSGIVSENDVKSKLQILTAREKHLETEIKATVKHKPKTLTADEIMETLSAPMETFFQRQQAVRSILRKVVLTRLDKGKKVSNIQIKIDLFFK